MKSDNGLPPFLGAGAEVLLHRGRGLAVRGWRRLAAGWKYLPPDGMKGPVAAALVGVCHLAWLLPALVVMGVVNDLRKGGRKK